MTVAYYPAIIERGANGFGVFFPDLPGCTSAGDTLQDAAKGAEEALQGWIDVSAEHGDAIPPPGTLDTIPADPDVDEAARVLVRADLPDKAARVTITLPESLLAEADLYAERMGFTRSGLLAQALRERMRRDRGGA